jgi:hypothetical protein
MWYDVILYMILCYDTIRYMIWYDIWYDDIWYIYIRYDIWYDKIRYMIRYDMIYDIRYMIWYDIWWYEIIWYDTIWYMINLWTAIRFPPSGSGRYSCTEIENKQLYTWRETIHKTIQKNRTHKIKSKTYTTKKHKTNKLKKKYIYIYTAIN